MIKELREIGAMVEPRDRRHWPFLVAVSLAGGLSRSLILVLINAGINARERPQALLLDALGIAAALGLTLWATRFAAVRGQEVSMRLAMRLRRRLRAQLDGANLRFIERTSANALHYYFTWSVTVIGEMYRAFLVYAAALVTLFFNFCYIGWLSPTGLAAGIAITVVAVSVHLRQERLNKERTRRFDQVFNAYAANHRAYLDGYKELRLGGDKNRDFAAQIDAAADDLIATSVDEHRTTSDGVLWTDLFRFLLIALVCLGLPMVSPMSNTTVMQLLAAILFTTGPLEGVVDFFPKFGKARVAWGHLCEVERQVATIGEGGGGAGEPLPAFESVMLRGTQFEFEPRDADDDASGERFRLGPIDFSLERGEVVFVVGGNGSGKTVMMRVLSGLYRPTAGDILYNGRALGDAQRQAYREQFSTVFGDFYLFEHLLGRRDTPEGVVAEWLSRFDLAGRTRYRDGRFSTVSLSAGQRKRLALLVSILDDRPVMVLDEFGAEQDPEHRDRFYREWLPLLRQMGRTLVVVSHDDRYFDCADRVVRMDFGQLAEVRGRRQRSGPAPVAPA